jgi:hypothetical protein
MKKPTPKAGDIYPYQVIRKKDGPAYFGFGHAQLDEQIRVGAVPAPIPLSATGRAKGWTGQQIIDHHAALMKLAERRQAEAAAEKLATAAVAKHFPKSKVGKSKSVRSKAEA